MAPSLETYVLDESVLLRAILDPDSAAADLLTHLMRSPAERGILPRRVAARFREFARTGLTYEATADGRIEEVHISAALITRWIGAHEALFAATASPPATIAHVDADVRPSLREVIATAHELGSGTVVSEYDVANAFPNDVLIVTSSQAFDIVERDDER